MAFDLLGPALLERGLEQRGDIRVLPFARNLVADFERVGISRARSDRRIYRSWLSPQRARGFPRGPVLQAHRYREVLDAVCALRLTGGAVVRPPPPRAYDGEGALSILCLYRTPIGRSALKGGSPTSIS